MKNKSAQRSEDHGKTCYSNHLWVQPLPKGEFNYNHPKTTRFWDDRKSILEAFFQMINRWYYLKWWRNDGPRWNTETSWDHGHRAWHCCWQPPPLLPAPKRLLVALHWAAPASNDGQDCCNNAKFRWKALEIYGNLWKHTWKYCEKVLHLTKFRVSIHVLDLSCTFTRSSFVFRVSQTTNGVHPPLPSTLGLQSGAFKLCFILFQGCLAPPISAGNSFRGWKECPTMWRCLEDIKKVYRSTQMDTVPVRTFLLIHKSCHALPFRMPWLQTFWRRWRKRCASFCCAGWLESQHPAVNGIGLRSLEIEAGPSREKCRWSSESSPSPPSSSSSSSWSWWLIITGIICHPNFSTPGERWATEDRPSRTLPYLAKRSLMLATWQSRGTPAQIRIQWEPRLRSWDRWCKSYAWFIWNVKCPTNWHHIIWCISCSNLI